MLAIISQNGRKMAKKMHKAAKMFDWVRMNKSALWILSEHCALKCRCLETATDLHESTEHKVRGKESK